MAYLLDYLRRYRDQPHVRPWALLSPILILLFCLPLLRPLRHPDPREISNDEAARLASIRAVGERGSLSIDLHDMPFTDRTVQDRITRERRYADQPPVMSFVLGGVYRLLIRFGLTYENNPILVPYLLTLIGVTLPVAAAAGLIYRMARVFELKRPWRAALALGVVCGSGLISYATVLNSHAPAATLVLCAVACIVHVTVTKRNTRSGGGWVVTAGWMVLAGCCAALASVIDIAAVVFMIALPIIIVSIRWQSGLRFAGVMFYALGCAPPLLLHHTLNAPITGDMRPGFLHPELWTDAHWIAQTSRAKPRLDGPTAAYDPAFGIDPDSDDDVIADSFWLLLGRNVNRLFSALVGSHGLLSHFPIILLGVAGIFAVMHRHWPTSTKLLAAVTLLGAMAIVGWYAWIWTDWQEPMFAGRWFIVFLPLLVFWTGAWLRRPHHPFAWTLAGGALAFSVAVSLLGATYPFPRQGFEGYTVTGAMKELVHPNKPIERAVLAGG